MNGVLAYVVRVPGQQDPTEEEIRQKIEAAKKLPPIDRLKVVMCDDIPPEPTDEDLDEIHRRFELGPEDKLFVCLVAMVPGAPMPPEPPPAFIGLVTALLLAGPPPRETLGCGNRECPTHGLAVIAAEIFREIMGEGCTYPECETCGQRKPDCNVH